VHARETPIGRLPEAADLATTGLDMPSANLDRLLTVDVEGWIEELPRIREHFAKFGERLPRALTAEVDALEQRLRAMK
jgi:phosphoenolpyruvate carboxykinase (GTP)